MSYLQEPELEKIESKIRSIMNSSLFAGWAEGWDDAPVLGKDECISRIMEFLKETVE